MNSECRGTEGGAYGVVSVNDVSFAVYPPLHAHERW